MHKAVPGPGGCESMTKDPSHVREGLVRTSPEKEVQWEFIEQPAERVMIVVDTARALKRIAEGGYDAIIFLDKSARPLHTIMQGAWRDLGLGEFPQVRFMAIGSLQDNLKNPDHPIQPRIIKEIRERYSLDPVKDKWGKVLVLDEKFSSGDSARAVARLFEQAFPEGIDQVEIDDVLEMYPSWFRRPEWLGVIEKADVIYDELKGVSNKREREELERELELAGESFVSERYKGQGRQIVAFRRELQKLAHEVVSCYPVVKELDDFEYHLKLAYSELNSILQDVSSKEIVLSEILPDLCKGLFLPEEFAYWQNQERVFKVTDSKIDELLKSLTLASNRKRVTALIKLQLLVEAGILEPEQWWDYHRHYDIYSPSWNRACKLIEEDLLS